MYRVIDIVLAFWGLMVSFPLMFLVIIIGYFDTGKPLFFQKRVGQHKVTFTLVKFRTMRVEAMSVGSHLISPDYVTNFGFFLRRYKLDELPQFFNVLKGDMSLVGPRPNLIDQTELTKLRDELNVYKVLPGLTGLAQIRNIDMSNPKLLVALDLEMIQSMSVLKYFTYIARTIFGGGFGDAVKK